MKNKKIKKVAKDYLKRNEVRCSVIIFYHRGWTPGCSTVVMPLDGASKQMVVELVRAVSRVVGFPKLYQGISRVKLHSSILNREIKQNPRRKK